MVKFFQKKIRIIGGLWKGYKIPINSSNNLRPTTHRMKKTIFEWLKYVIKGSRCLDCFAGTGGLGIEALSRGANEVFF